ncbi:phosphotransferase family protein [Gordonia sp. zg691]|uniref:phosphotransferase family protein n=1 Tax=Gordonia jinghuaiqii TaxID=2758710 RepID=UPI00166243E4|nr:phosphotransferase family protein [Gordonia jinghuaiqii]MBD0860361.1 phosphotransferase family protein [Gordonia jinghuaiqii]
MATPTIRSSVQVEPIVDLALKRKLERRGSVVHETPSLDAVSARLREFLARRVDGDFTVRNMARLAGGASKEQFVFDLDWRPGGTARTDRMVLRMDPPGSMVETPRRREFEVLQGVRGTVPVPAVHWVTEDAAELGAPSMICGYVSGSASAANARKTASGLGTVYGAELRAELAPQFVSHLAALHRFDWSGLELGSFERPEEGTTQAVDWRLASIDRAWQEDSYEAHPVIALTQEWLWERRPPVDRVSIVHGDYRNGNFLFDEDSGTITALLDWELTYLGDRHHDLAYAMMEGWGERDTSTGEFYCSALVTREQLTEQYERESGLSVDPERLEYYTVLNMYWAAVALIGTGPRNSAERLTHLDAMQTFLAGLGAFYADQLLAIVGKD